MWWKQYRKTVIPTQLMILTICMIAIFYVRLMLLTVLVYFAVMQLFAVLGAMWAVRLQGKIIAGRERRNKLPLA